MGICVSKSIQEGGINGQTKGPAQMIPDGIPEASSSSTNEIDDQRREVNFIAPPKTVNEEERVKLLRALNILDTEREDRFSSITRLLCSVFDVPIAAVSLVDADKQWFKAAEGLGEVCQTGRDVSFCGHTILGATPQILVVEDALQDVRFAGNPLVVGEPYIRFYAGAPLVSSANGYRYGSVCIIDTRPHKNTFTSEHYNLLAQFAELAVREIEKDKIALLQKMVREQRELSISGSASPSDSLRASSITSGSPEMSAPWGLSRAADCFVEGVMLIDAGTPAWTVLYANAAFSTVLGLPRDEAISQGFWELFGGNKAGLAACYAAIELNEPFSITVTLQSIYRQTPKAILVDFRPAAVAQLGMVGVPVAMESTESSSPASGAPLQIRHYFAIVHPDAQRGGGMRRLYNGRAESVALATQPLESYESQRRAGSPTIPPMSKVMPSAFTDVRLGPLIGRGAYGRVYRGSWNGNTVAVKVMETSECVTGIDNDEEESAGGGARGLFEAVLSSSLSHPNVVHTYQYAVRPLDRAITATAANGVTKRSQIGGQLTEVWLISEFCNRGPLLTAIERGAFLTQPSAQYGQPNLIAVLQTLQEIAAAMHYLHGHDIVHGDLTGGNVLLTSFDKDARGFTAKVVDFGLSRICGEAGYLKTKTMGCAEYMPPELIRGGILTKASDVYAFGVIAWEIYVGRRAWEGLQAAQVLKRVASNERLEFPSQTPHRLRVLGDKCMAADPTVRPTFTEILCEVNAILADTMSILQQFLHATAPKAVK